MYIHTGYIMNSFVIVNLYKNGHIESNLVGISSDQSYSLQIPLRLFLELDPKNRFGKVSEYHTYQSIKLVQCWSNCFKIKPGSNYMIVKLY